MNVLVYKKIRGNIFCMVYGKGLMVFINFLNISRDRLKRSEWFLQPAFHDFMFFCKLRNFLCWLFIQSMQLLNGESSKVGKFKRAQDFLTLTNL